MGLRDRIAKRAAAKGPDIGAVLTTAVGPAETIRAWAQVVPSAYERGGGGIGLSGKLLNRAVDGVINAASKQRHIGGEEGSVAHSLPRDGSALYLVLGATDVTWWDMGGFGENDPPQLRARLAAGQVVSIVDTGETAQGGVKVARITFGDGSFFDYRILWSTPEFWTSMRSS